MALMCKAPFVSQAQWTSGAVCMCCNDTRSTESSLEEEWNSEERKKTRRQILNNQVPKRCKSCLLKSSSLIGHYNDNLNITDEQLIAACDPDGFMNTPPVYLHLSPTNKCQLACRMCSKQVSSTFDKLYSDIDSPYTKNKRNTLVNPDDVVAYVRKVLPTLQEYVFHGGEPMMSSYFEDIVGSLLEVKDTVRLVILGNGMTINTPQGEKAIALMKQFKEVEFILSLDGIPEVNDYQRCLSDANTIVNNVKYLREVIPHLELRLNHTLTNISIIKITEFYDFVLEHFPGLHSLNHGFVRTPEEFQVKNLPDMVRKRILKELNEYDPSHLPFVFIKAFTEMKMTVEREFALPFDPKVWAKFIKYDADISRVHHKNGNTFTPIMSLLIPVKSVV